MDKRQALQAALNELLNFKIFEGMSIVQIQELCLAGEIIVNQHRQMLYKFGEPADSFGIVLSGAYKLSRPSPNGEDTIVHFSTPGEVIAAFIMPQTQPVYPVSSYAMGPSRFLKLPREVFLQKWKGNPDLIFRVQSLLSSRMGGFQAQKSLTKAPLSAKIAHLLIDILNKYEGNGALIPLPLTRKEIADSLGASVESVIRIMSDWSKNGIIETQDQQIKILKLNALIQEMESSAN